MCFPVRIAFAVVVTGCVLAASGAQASLVDEAIGFWSFGEGSGSPTADSSITTPNIPLTLAGSPAWQTTGGPSGNYLSFGAGDYLTTGGDQNALDFNSTDPFSVAAWVKRADTDGFDYVMSKMESSGSYRGWAVQLRSDSTGTLPNSVGLWLRSNTSNYLAAYTAEPVDTTSDWVHIAVTYDGSTNFSGVNIYVDGEAVDTAQFGNSLDPGEDTTNSISFNIAGRNQSNAYGGSVDEVGVWDRELTPQEVSSLLLVPEPSSLLLWGLGLALGCLVGRRRRSRR